jgi:acyl-CoA synthetase (AMP-forming)/AMP-acid ligase II
MFELSRETVEPRARAAAAWLAERGVARGDRVAVVSENVPGFVPFTLGALRRGIVPVLVNVHLAPEERARIIADCDPKLVVRSFPETDGSVELADVPLARPMHYTSGTTGVAKGVWSGVLDEDDARALAEDEAELWAAERGDTVLVCSPLYHSAPHRIAVSALLAGARVLVFERFDADGIIRAFLDEGASGAFLVPTHLRRLLAAGLTGAPRAKRILHAGEPCPEPLKRAALDVIPSLWEFYGSTEGQFTVCSPGEWLERPGTVGRARRGRELFIEDGLIYVTAPSFARWEYWRDREKTAKAWKSIPIEGARFAAAFTVGDHGHLDDQGYLFIDGRREDLIISGGVNVYPAEVERVLEAHDGVREVAVFGVPDDEYGQRVCAAIVGDADLESLKRWARERLPGSHAPKSFVRLGRLPRTATGKVKRADLHV